MWRRAATAALSLGVGAGAVAVASAEDPAATLKVCTHLPPRLLRDSVTAATIAFDYKWSLWGLEPGTPAWQSAKHDTHLRSATDSRSSASATAASTSSSASTSPSW